MDTVCVYHKRANESDNSNITNVISTTTISIHQSSYKTEEQEKRKKKEKRPLAYDNKLIDIYT